MRGRSFVEPCLEHGDRWPPPGPAKLRLVITASEREDEEQLAEHLLVHKEFARLLLEGAIPQARANLAARLDDAEQAVVSQVAFSLIRPESAAHYVSGCRRRPECQNVVRRSCAEGAGNRVAPDRRRNAWSGRGPGHRAVRDRQYRTTDE